MTKIVQLIKPTRAEVVYAQGDFANAKQDLESEGYRVASTQEISKARIELGKNAGVSRFGGWTKEGFIYLKDNDVRLTKNSPIMVNLKEAVYCHKTGKEFYLTKKQLEQAVKDSIKINEKLIPTNRFGENEFAIYVFGENAQQYGDFLREAKIKNMLINLINTEEKPFARQLWFCDLDYHSELAGDHWGLDDDNSGTFGVNLSADEGSCECAENTSLGYTPTQISKALKRLQISGLESQIFDALKQ